jgi:hypothetical protein
MSLRARNLKIGPSALGTVKNEFGSAKAETWPHALDIAENESENIKVESWTQRPWYCKKGYGSVKVEN